jgi:hypothetical protein
MISAQARREWRRFQQASLAVVVFTLTAATGEEDTMLKKVISGGQTGADRGALEACKGIGWPYGGWIPKGRKAEDGQVPAEFDQLQEHPHPGYRPRTRSNVQDADGTLIICVFPMSPGSKLTLRFCRELDKPVMVLDAAKLFQRRHNASAQIKAWLSKNEIVTLNVAGSRESKCPGLQDKVGCLLEGVLLDVGGAYAPPGAHDHEH